MRRAALGFLAPIVLAACVATKGDLERIHARMKEGERHVNDVLAQLEAGTASKEQVVEAVKVATNANVNEVAAVIESVDARGDKIGTTAALWMELIGGTVGVAASVLITNYMRDKQRMARGEPIGKELSPNAQIVAAVAEDMRARTAANVDAGRS